MNKLARSRHTGKQERERERERERMPIFRVLGPFCEKETDS